MTETVSAIVDRPYERTLRFVWSHRIHVLLCMPMLIGVTVLHEGAHALAVVLQGGTVTGISVWPSHGLWGYVLWREPQQGFAHRELVSLAPYILWLGMAALAACIASIPARKPFWLASILFVWFYAVPVLDIANAVVSYGLAASGDLGSAFGPAPLNRALVVAASVAGLGTAGYPVQRGLYGENALGWGGYAFLSSLAALALTALHLR